MDPTKLAEMARELAETHAEATEIALDPIPDGPVCGWKIGSQIHMAGGAARASSVAEKFAQKKMSSDRDRLIAGLRPLVPDAVNVIAQECALETVAEAAAGEAPSRAKVARAWKLWREGAGRAELLRAKAMAAKADAGHAAVVNGHDLVLTIAVYHPRKNPGLKTQEFTVRGSHSLKQLRDRLECIDEINFYGHDSQGPPPKPSFFFIGGRFYSDTSVTHNVQRDGPRPYATELAAWLRKTDPKALKEPAEPAAGMETRFIDLDVQLNAPYLFYHHGGCEHHVYVTDIRLAHETDAHLGPAPALCYEFQKKREDCMICHLFPSGFVVHNDAGLPFNPCFICRHCKPKVDDICRGSTSQGQVGTMKRTEAIYTYDI